MLCMFLLMLLGGQSDYQVVQSFQELPKDSDDFLTNPYTMHFSHEGKLYVADRATGRIHIWNKDGEFEKSFAGPGKGPGELEAPIRMVVTEDHVWVWELSQQISIFKTDGSFERSFKVPGITPRAFAVLNPDLLLVIYRGASGSGGEAEFMFQLINSKGEKLKTLKTFTKETLAPIKGDNRTIAKAFGPEGDIQRAPDGTWWFGFSEGRKLYQVNSSGEIIGQKTFEIPTDKPNKEERKLVEEMSFATPNGQRLSLKNLPHMKISYDHNKAYYTHFLFSGDDVIFALTPIGGFNGLGNGFYHASYSICGVKSGKLHARGIYEFPLDSSVLYRDGRILAIIMNEEKIEIKEIRLKGQ